MADAARWPRRLGNTVSLAALAAVERQVPFWSAARVERLQRRRVRAIVRHAYRTVPFYRRAMDGLGLRPDDVRTAADLARLPLIDVDALRRDPDDFLSTAESRDRSVALSSGGSTGTPHAVHHDTAALLANAAHGERERAIVASLIGRRVGYRETVLAPPFSSMSEVHRSVQAHTLLPAQVRIERQFLSLLDPPARIVSQIEAFKPDVLHGFGSGLALLFAHHEATGAAFHRPKAVTFSSDALPHGARRTIEEVFGIPVLGTYQAIEALKIGFECGRGEGYHLNTDLYPVRIVDESGRELGPGETGDVVVSNLVNRSTVLLNYRLGDLATLAPEPCPCGRSLPLLASLDGRRGDVFVLPSGRVVHQMAVLVYLDPEVRQYQIVQEEPDRFRLGVVAAGDADRERLRCRLVASLAGSLGEPVTIDVAFVDAVERTAGGKVRPFVSRCWDGNGWIDAAAKEPSGG